MNAQDLAAILPLMILGGSAVLLMLAVSFYRDHRVSTALALAGLGLSFAAVFPASAEVPRRVTNMLVIDGYALFFIGVIIGAALLVTLLSYGYNKGSSVLPDEYYMLMLLATLGGCVLAASGSFISFFLGLEILSVSLYALIAYRRGARAEEAGFKYLVLAGVSSAFLLFGMALIYAQSGTMEFARLAQMKDWAALGPVGFAGAVMIIIGAGFKLAVAPFHMWTPDVYEGAGAPVSALVASVSKGAVFAVLFRFFAWTGGLSYGPLSTIVASIAILSMFTGNLLALFQDNIKRVLAYSSIAHLGYLLIALLSTGEAALVAAQFYIVAYFISIAGAFGVIAILSGQGGEAEKIEDYRGLARKNPWLSAVLALMLFSLAGLPLTAGFIGKFYLATAGVSSQLWTLVIVLAINSAISVFYYLRITAVLYGPAERGLRERAHFVSLSGAALCVIVFLLLWLGVYPSTLVRIALATFSGLFTG